MWIWNRHAWEQAARKKAINDAIREASLMVKECANGVFFCRGNGLIQEVNRAFTDLLGYESSEVVGQTLGFWLPMVFNQGLYSNLKSALEEDGQWCGEVWISPVSGKIFCAWLSLCAFSDHEGSVMYFSGVVDFEDRLVVNR